MERKAVKSSTIAEIGFENGVAEVAFKARKGGAMAVWRYSPIEQSVWHEWEQAPSLGGFFAARIKPHYHAEKVQ